MNNISGTNQGRHRELETPEHTEEKTAPNGALKARKQDESKIISLEEERKIFDETWKLLKTDTFIAFAFKADKNHLWMSRYILGNFNEKYLISLIEEALRFHRLVEKDRKESTNAVYEKVRKDIETMEEGNDSIELFNISLKNFGDAIVCMGVDELQSHMLYARGIIEHLQEQLEELGYLNAEYEKHGTARR